MICPATPMSILKLFMPLLILVLLAINNIDAQCDVDLNVQTTNVSIIPFNGNACLITVDYQVENNSPCSNSSFTMIFRFETHGVQNAVETIYNPIPGNGLVNRSFSFPSTIFYDPYITTCYDEDDIQISVSYSGIDPPTVLTETIACPFGDGTVVVCAEDFSEICDDEGCEPYSCSLNVGVNVDVQDLDIWMNEDSECELFIPYSLTSSGTCDASSFAIDIEVVVQGNTQLIMEYISGISAGNSLYGNVNLVSGILFKSPDCYNVSDVQVNASISNSFPPTVITETVACPYGNGTMEVCANNPYIICSDALCDPWSCGADFEFQVDAANLSIDNVSNGNCEITIPYNGINVGDCDMENINVVITVTNPNGTILVFNQFQNGLIPANTNFSNTYIASSTFFSTGASTCYEISDFQISVALNYDALPEAVTITLPCSGGAGTMTVCTNNSDVICDISSCSFALPIDLLALEGEVIEENILLNWITMTEINNDYFIVEYSSDGIKFKELAKVQGKGNSNEEVNYAYLHHNPSFGNNYYRLSQFDANGEKSYSNIIQIKTFFSENELVFYPNPAFEKLTIEYLIEDKNAYVELFTVDGRLIKKQMLQENQYMHHINIRTLEPGIYMMHVAYQQKLIARKFAKI